MEEINKKLLWVIAIVNVLTLILLAVFFVMSWDVITKKPQTNGAQQQYSGAQQPSGLQQPSGAQQPSGLQQPSGAQQPVGGVKPPAGGAANPTTIKACVDACVQGGKTFQACITQCENQ